MPRPSGPTVYGSKPNVLIQFDCIEMDLGSTCDKYILMLQDDHSGYAWFYPPVRTSAETAAHDLQYWCAALGAPSQFMSDGPIHFKNETLRNLAKGLGTPHHFTLPYCPWSNGAVERLGKELLRVARAILSELQQRPDKWPQLVHLSQSALNNLPSPQRNNVAPITAFTGHPPSTPTSKFLRSFNSTPLTLTGAQQEHLINVKELTKLMDDLHPMVKSAFLKQRDRMRTARHRGDLPKFTDGDYVLVAHEQLYKGERLCLPWRGPRRISTCLSNYVFQVEDLGNGELENVHGTRLKVYSDSSIYTEAILFHVLASETGMPVSRLLSLVKQDNKISVLVRWKGLGKNEDKLERLKRVYEDVPVLLVKLMQRKNTDATLQSKACAELILDEGVCTDPPDRGT